MPVSAVDVGHEEAVRLWRRVRLLELVEVVGHLTGLPGGWYDSSMCLYDIALKSCDTIETTILVRVLVIDDVADKHGSVSNQSYKGLQATSSQAAS